MRTHLLSATTATAPARDLWRRAAWRSRWLDFSALLLITVVLVDCLTRPPSQPPMLDPLLAVPPALAAIGAATVRRPLFYGAVSLLAAVVIAAKPNDYADWLPVVTMFTVVVITAVATAGTITSVRQERRIAQVRSVAEAAQRAVLRPLPPRLGSLSFDVVYIAAAAEAKVGGDLYEAVATSEHGIRVIMGDVRGKGLGAVELATDVLGMFREQAHEAYTLGDLAARLDAGLGRGLGRHEEFVTALLVEIDPESGRTSIFSCGHPPPLLIPAGCGGDTARCVTLMEVPAPAPPLGLLALGDASDAQLCCTLQPDDQLLLYTDGVTEARDARRAFYPLPERVGALAAKAAGSQAAGKAVLRSVSSGTSRQGLLDLLRADLHKHVGAPIDDDAAMLLVRAPATWPADRTAAASARVTRIA
jgi:serine phosphatase RsbU (regulator of sigma subunit)